MPTHHRFPTRRTRTLTLIIAALGLLAGPATLGVGAHGPAESAGEALEAASVPASHEADQTPSAADGYLAHVLADAQAPTVLAFHEGSGAGDQLPSADPPTQDLYYANLAGEIVHVDLAWTPLGPAAVDRTVVADGFNQPLGLAFDDDGTMYVSDSYDHRAAQRPVGVVYAVDLGTGDRQAIVDGVPNGQHNINHIRFGPDDRLYLPVGNPNDSGNGTGTGHTDVFPYTGAFLSVDVDRLEAEGPAVLHWQDADGDPIADEDIVDHERNEGFADKVDVFAFGFRNVFGITWAPDPLPFGGAAYTGTNGADNPNSQDTLERIHPGAHHGYPFCISQGTPGDTANLAKQHWAGSPHTGFDCSNSPPAEALLGYHVCATGLDFPTQPQTNHPDHAFPADRRSSVFVGECGFFQAQNTITESLEHPSRHNTGHEVTEVRLDETGDAVEVRPFVEGLALPTDVQFGPDGAMYVADAGSIVRVAPTPLARTGTGDLLPAPVQATTVPLAAVGQSFAPPVSVVPTGTTLEWTSGAIPHTVTSSEHVCTPDNGEACANDADAGSSFDRYLSGVGDTVQVTVEEPGVYPYFCKFHYQLGMTGLIVALDPEDPTAVGPEDVVDAIDQVPAAHSGHGHVPSVAG